MDTGHGYATDMGHGYGTQRFLKKVTQGHDDMPLGIVISIIIRVHKHTHRAFAPKSSHT